MTRINCLDFSKQLPYEIPLSLNEREECESPTQRIAIHVILTPRETAIPLDVQYAVTKKVDQQNFSDYEVRIQSLQHEVELLRKRYLDMMAVYDRNLANEEVIKLQELKIQQLQQENQDLYTQIRGLIKVNDELKQRFESINPTMRARAKMGTSKCN